MITLDFRKHVIDWKMTFHIFPNRELNDQEWSEMRSLPKAYRFQCGEQIDKDSFFWAYTKNSKNGMWVASKDKIKIAIKNSKTSRAKRREKANAYRRAKYQENPEPTIKRTSEYHKRNRDKSYKKQMEWKKKNPDKIKKYYKTEFQKSLIIPHKRIIRLLRMRIRCAVTNSILHGRKTEYESAQFLIWLAARKNISNLLDYEIDHLVPISKWDLTIQENQEAANAPENVQWLTVAENIAKSDNMPTPEQIAEHRALVAQWRAETSALAA